MNRMLCLAIMGLGLMACEQKADAPSNQPTPSKATATTTAAPTGAQAEIPTEQDFEDQAEKDITAQNLDGELDKLEKEVGQ